MEPKMRTYVPVIVRGKESEGVKFWGFGKTVYTELLGFIADPDYGDLSDPMNGRDIVVEFTPSEGPGQYPKTAIRVKPNTTPVTEDNRIYAKTEEKGLIVMQALSEPLAVKTLRKRVIIHTILLCLMLLKTLVDQKDTLILTKWNTHQSWLLR